MISRYRLSLFAERDLEEAVGYLRGDQASEEVALRFVAASRETFELIARHPEIGREYRPEDERLAGMRAFRVHLFDRYLVFYRVQRDAVFVERVLHGSRDLWAIFGLEDE